MYVHVPAMRGKIGNRTYYSCLMPMSAIPNMFKFTNWIGFTPEDREQRVLDEKRVPEIKKYILEIVHSSREHEDILLGGSPRASIALFRTAQALAAIAGRDFVIPDDVKRMAQPVLAHRLILRPESRLRKKTPASVVAELVADVKVPMVDRAVKDNVDYFK